MIVRSFARIHEANLKKQGVLSLFTFANPDDYERIQAEDTIDRDSPTSTGRPVEVVVHHANGTSETISTTQTMSEEHIAWFRAGAHVLRLEGRGRGHDPRPHPVVVPAVREHTVVREPVLVHVQAPALVHALAAFGRPRAPAIGGAAARAGGRWARRSRTRSRPVGGGRS